MNTFIITAINNTKTMIIMSGNGFRSLISGADQLKDIVKKSVITDVKPDGHCVMVFLRAPADTPVGRTDPHPEGGITTTYVFRMRLSHESQFGNLYVVDVVPI